MTNLRPLPRLGCVLALLLTAHCTDEAPPVLPEAPSIVRFEASPSKLTRGEPTTLSFEAANAETVTLLDPEGAPVSLEGDSRSGRATVTPTGSGYFLLRVMRGEQSAVASAEVTVDGVVAAPFLKVVPENIVAGEAVQLLWANPKRAAATLTEDGGRQLPLEPGANAGALELRPTRTTTYRLAFQSELHEAPLEATATVAPKILRFVAAPSAALPGSTVTFRWEALGGESLELREETFGVLTTLGDLVGTSGPAEWTWTVPTTLPGGAPVPREAPLRYSLEIKTREAGVSALATADGWLGDGPAIDQFEVPAAVSAGKPMLVRWRTRNVAHLRVLVNGLVVHSPTAEESAELPQGTVTLPAPASASDITLEVESANERVLRQTRNVRPVGPPVIRSFSVPAQIAQAGAAAQARWQTEGATSVVLRLGTTGTIFRAAQAATSVSGNTDLHPVRTSTVVLEAFNDAGEVATLSRNIEVRTPAPVTARPELGYTQTRVDLVHDYGTLPIEEIYGVSNAAPTLVDLENWVELGADERAERVSFVDWNEAVTDITVPGFHFPFFDGTHGRFWISVNGFIGLAPMGPSPRNPMLPSLAHPPLLAPFWQDLSLGANGRVLWKLEGETYPRRLVIEWKDVSISRTPSTRLTFQAQLLETGEFRFLYQSLPPTETGSLATIGAQHPGNQFPVEGTAPVGATRIESGTGNRYFVSTFNGTQASQYVLDHARFFSAARLTNGRYVGAELPVRIFGPNAVRISEVMPSPANHVAPSSDWIELSNPRDLPVDVSGLTLTAAQSEAPFTIPAGSVIPAGGQLVLSSSLTPGTLDGVPATVSYGQQVPFAFADLLRLQVGQDTVSSLSWTTVIQGRSVEAPSSVIGSTAQTPSCAANEATYGSNENVGTPGQPSPACFPYRTLRATSAFRDIAATGTPLFDPTQMDSNLVRLDLSAHPVPLFGAPADALFVSTNGFFSLVGDFLPTYAFKNGDAPSSAMPGRAFALFGDDLRGNPAFADTGIFAEWIEPGVDAQAPVGHWILQWNHVSTTLQTYLDDTSFQAKLFEDGTVEFHYGHLGQNHLANTRALGETAIIWIQDDQLRALPLSIRSASLQSQRTYRFVPEQP